EDAVVAAVDLLVDGAWIEPEVEHARARDRHLRHDARIRLEKLEVLEHRMPGEPELADHADALRLGLDALELDAVVGLVELDPVKHGEEIEVPPRAPEVAVARKLQSDLLLLLDHVPDLAVLDLLELGVRDLALLAPGARLLEGGGTQEAADLIGAERR